MRDIKRIIIHCTATEPQYDIGAEEIRVLHMMTEGTPITWCGIDTAGKGFRDIGYHRVIRRDGKIESGRRPYEIGAHVKGHNGDSLGIALVGGLGNDKAPDCNFTSMQWASLENEVFWTMSEHGSLEMFGHRDFSNKACPTFDVKAWWG